MMLIRPWWDDRTRREQILLTIMLVLLAVTLLWLALLRPLALARSAAADRLGAALAAEARITAMAGSLQAIERRRAPATTPLLDQISQSASAAGLTIERLESPGDGAVAVRITAIRAEPLLRWLAALEQQDSILVERGTIRRNGDATVMVQLTLRQAAR